MMRSSHQLNSGPRSIAGAVRGLKAASCIITAGLLFGPSSGCLPNDFLATLFADSLTLVVNSVISAFLEGVLAPL